MGKIRSIVNLLFGKNDKHSEKNLADQQQQDRYFDEEYLNRIIECNALQKPENLDLTNPKHTIDLAIQLEEKCNIIEAQEFITRRKHDALCAMSDKYKHIIQDYLMNKGGYSREALMKFREISYADLGRSFAPEKFRSDYTLYFIAKRYL